MKLWRSIPVAFVMGLFVLGACSSDDTGGTAGGVDAATGMDSTSGDSASGDTSLTDSSTTTDTSTAACTNIDGGASCNALVQEGADESVMVVAGPIPTGTGGTIADGRYILTDIKTYDGSMLTGVTLKQTLELCAGVGQFINDRPGKATVHKTFTIAPTGVAPNIKETCVTGPAEVEIPYTSYTATPTALTFYSTAFVFSVTFTKK